VTGVVRAERSGVACDFIDESDEEMGFTEWRQSLRILLFMMLLPLISASEIHENGRCAMRGQVDALFLKC